MRQLDLGDCATIGKSPFDRPELILTGDTSKAETGDLVVGRTVVGEARDPARYRHQKACSFATPAVRSPAVRGNEIDLSELNTPGKRRAAEQGLTVAGHG
jgi:hypothetical protein